MENERGREQVALLMVDVQNAMVEAAYRGKELLANVGLLLGRARETGTPVIYVQHDGDDSYGPMKPGEPGWYVHEEVAPLSDEPIVRKRFSDSFYGTALDAELRSRGVKSLVVSGMSTEFCIDATCRGARRHGYEVTLVGDAHTTVKDEVLEVMGRGDGPSAARLVAHHNYLLGGLHHAHPDLKILVLPTREIYFARQGPRSGPEVLRKSGARSEVAG